MRRAGCGAGRSQPFILGVVGWVDLRSSRLRMNCNPSQEPQARRNSPTLYRASRTTSATTRFLAWDLHAGEFDLAYDILIYTKHLPIAVKFVGVPRQRFVLDHLAKPPIKRGA